ncbi:MAG: hypothetical protein IT235_07540 [Bacteroidia bacterium]|nr:hypothetical protein [Bacteroidia bacterium]
MKLYATLTNSKGKKEGIGDNEWIEIELSFGNLLIGRVIMRYEEVNNNSFAAYFYPITSNIGKSGRILLHEARQKQQGEKWLFDHGGECKICHRVEITELNKQNICFECFK